MPRLPLLALLFALACRAGGADSAMSADAAGNGRASDLQAPPGACRQMVHCAGAQQFCMCIGDQWSCRTAQSDGGAAPAPGWLPAMLPGEGSDCSVAEACCWLPLTERTRRCRCDGRRWQCEELPADCPAGITAGAACTGPGTTCKLHFCWWCECVPEGTAATWQCSTLGFLC
jgi:hypothetical protein